MLSKLAYKSNRIILKKLLVRKSGKVVDSASRGRSLQTPGIEEASCAKRLRFGELVYPHAAELRAETG